MARGSEELEVWLVEQAGLRPICSVSDRFCATLEERGPRDRAVLAALRSVEPAAELRVVDGVSVLRARTSSARPLLSVWARSLPGRLGVRFDLQPEKPETALGYVRAQTGLDLSAARVRVHIAHARLLELEFFAVATADEKDGLEDAAQLFTEYVLGDRVYETWVGALSLSVVAKRPRSLLVLGDGAHKEDFSILETATLVGAARQALESGRAMPQPASDLWYALELPEADDDDLAGEPNRRFASTCVPAALKGALEGLPFYPERFFPDGFELLFLAWKRGPETEDARRDVEQLILSLDARICVVGSGFGARHDFLDALVPTDLALIERLLSGLNALGVSGRLGFYRTDYHELYLTFGVDSSLGPSAREPVLKRS